MISSTPLRKSVNKKVIEDFECTPLQEYNDDHERASRRSVYGIERSLSNVPEFSSTETLEQVTEHMKMCQKLFSENKINIRNAWEINVIDYMHQYVSKNKIVNFEVMLEGARMLEVCVKVFSCKVDYLSQEIVKLISNKERASEEDEENSVIDSDNANQTVEKRTKKKKKTRARPTLMKDKKSILLNGIPKMVPNDFVGNIDINANNYQNMSTNKIPMDHCRCKFNLLNNEERGFISYNDEDPTLQEKLFPNMFPVIKPITICPEFKNFNVDEDDQTFNDSLSSIVNDREKSRSLGLINNEVVYDDDGIPIPDLDGSIHDVFADDAEPIDFDGEEIVTGQTANRRIEMITSFCPLEIPTEKNALDRSITNNTNIFLETVWVGPSHWKNKRILQSRSRYSGKPDQKIPQSRRKKRSIRPQSAAIDFNASPVINFQKFCRGKAKHDIKKYTLPVNDLFSATEFDNLILQELKPKLEYQSKEAKESEFEHSPYDYDNPDDSQYCSQVDLPDVNDNIADGKETDDGEQAHDVIGNCIENPNGPENDLPVCLDTEDALVEGPDLVTQVYVPYAHRAKNVNMRRLKSAMLECLIGETVENNASTEELHIQPTTFSTILKQLPSKLPKKVRNDISVPMAFFSLLHLTNEHNLELMGSDRLDDVKIK